MYRQHLWPRFFSEFATAVNFAAGIFVLCLSLPVLGEELPRPEGLEPEVAFWRRVFTEVTTDQALVHDNRQLGVIYEVVDIPADTGPRKRRKIADKIRGKYRRVLNSLATGKRNGLTSDERRVLSLWPDDVSNDELRQAAKRVRFQQGLANRFHAGLVRSGQWQDHIRVSLRQEGVPESLAVLPHVESSFNPEARSHVGAVGLWQFTRSTGKRFMRIDHVVDERRDPYLSSDAAARLLSYNQSILRSWPLAITAYNHGVAGMRRAVKRMGTEDIEVIIRNYSGRSFGFASRNFYVAFLAALEVELNADTYFGPLQRASPRDEYVVVMPEYVPVDVLESVLGVKRDTLEAYNPALLAPVWKGTKYVPRGYGLRLPELDMHQPPEQILVNLPAGQRFAEQTPDLYHKVQRGDSLSVIAARYRTSVSELVALNGLRSRHLIRAGQVLRLPFKGRAPDRPIPGDAATYVVRRGDTVGEIAARAGISEADLMALNTLTNRNRIYPGQELMLQPATSAPEPAAVQAVADTGLQTEVVLDEGPSADAANDTPILADPSDYLVAADGSIEIQAAETLGHYADWLAVPTQRLRNLNGYSYRQPVVIGRRIRLDLGKVSAETFVARRIAYHRELQDAFFSRYRITDTKVHQLRRGESVWVLAQWRYKVPVWLLRQYNPDIDLNRVRPGTKLIFPRIAPIKVTGGKANTLADVL